VLPSPTPVTVGPLHRPAGVSRTVRIRGSWRAICRQGGGTAAIGVERSGAGTAAPLPTVSDGRQGKTLTKVWAGCQRVAKRAGPVTVWQERWTSGAAHIFYSERYTPPSSGNVANPPPTGGVTVSRQGGCVGWGVFATHPGVGKVANRPPPVSFGRRRGGGWGKARARSAPGVGRGVVSSFHRFLGIQIVSVESRSFQ
jgi:hypothetical protein